ncbi:hypothetical protein F5I97DRAFT_1806364, partial [Phlebopus sp. FC_14]
LGIFLYTCITGLSTKHVGEHFQWSNDIISKYVTFLKKKKKRIDGVIQKNALHILTS